MTTTRADKFTSATKKQEFYSDFLNTFAMTPVGNELGRVVNERSVTQSIKNLIKTNLGSRLFQPNVGSNVYYLLFEMNDLVSKQSVIFNIKNTINYYEPRCNLMDVEVTNPDEYTAKITIVYALINDPAPITINMILERVR